MNLNEQATCLPSDYRTIPLTQGKVTIVDAADYEWLSQWKWHLHPTPNKLYAVRVDKLRRRVWMHREILNPPPGMEPDHKNGDGLDNRRSNLRPATRMQNGRNRKLQSNNASGVKGVQVRSSGAYRARIRVSGKLICLGQRGTLLEAAQPYDEAAVKYFGEFARLNFPK